MNHLCIFTILSSLVLLVSSEIRDRNSAVQALSKPNSCPVWTTTTKNNTCKCGKKFGGSIECSNRDRNVTIPNCFCLSRIKNVTVIGYCVVSCYISRKFNNPLHDPVSGSSSRYKILVSNVYNETETNRRLCNYFKFNRVGQMCGSCEEGYALPVYSYSLKCVKCSENKLNWLKYIAIAYLPATLFYTFVVLFRISAASARVNGYIATCQILIIPNNLRLVSLISRVNTATTLFGIKIGCTFYGIWNLDFFRSVYTPFCIHPQMSTLQTLALDYAIAVYPLLLVVLTYILVTLHDHYVVVVRLWRPFYKCFRFFRNEWDIKTSLVNAFATFILLSYIKILNTSLDLLTFVNFYNRNGEKLNQQFLQVDATIEYFGKEHLPYALLAIVMCFFFNFLPLLLLCLYSCRCFHRCMNHFNLHNQTVHTFIEVYQGCFKTHPQDFRFFAAFYIMLRAVNVTLSFGVHSFVYSPIVGGILIFTLIAIAGMKPYKTSIANYIDIIIFSIGAFGCFCVPVETVIKLIGLGRSGYLRALNVIFLIGGIIHFFYGIVILMGLFLPKKLKNCLSHFYKKYIKSIWNSSPEEPDIPHRLRHPDHPEYAPLITEEEAEVKSYN